MFPIVPVPCSVNKPLVWGHLKIINPQNVGFNILAEDWRGDLGRFVHTTMMVSVLFDSCYVG